MNKIFYPLCLITLNLVLGFRLVGQDMEEGQVTKSIYIDHSKSHIEILGKTNINQFKCSFEMASLKKKNSIELSPSSNQQQIVDGTIRLKVDDFSCDNSQMTYDFKKLLKHEQYPYITLQVLKITSIAENEYHVQTSIRLAGEERKYTMQTTAITQNDMIQGSGRQVICITDFGLVAPEKFFGMVKVNENISINFYLVFQVK